MIKNGEMLNVQNAKMMKTWSRFAIKNEGVDFRP